MTTEKNTPQAAAAITAHELVSIAHVLIDAQDIDDNPDDDQLLVRAGIKTGITTMCLAATNVLNASTRFAGQPQQASASSADAATVAVLRRLDGYMAASGYDADHPWRREIAGASSAAEPCTLCAGDGGDFGESKCWHKCPHCDGRAVEPELTTSGPDLADRPDLLALRERLRADLAAPAPKVNLEDVVETLAQLRDTANEAIDHEATAVCRRATRVIEGLLPHAGDGVLA